MRSSTAYLACIIKAPISDKQLRAFKGAMAFKGFRSVDESVKWLESELDSTKVFTIEVGENIYPTRVDIVDYMRRDLESATAAIKTSSRILEFQSSHSFSKLAGDYLERDQAEGDRADFAAAKTAKPITAEQLQQSPHSMQKDRSHLNRFGAFARNAEMDRRTRHNGARAAHIHSKAPHR